MVGDIFQPTHLLFVLVVALLVLGPKRLPEVGRTLGAGIRDFRQALSGEASDRSRHQDSEQVGSTATEMHDQPQDVADDDFTWPEEAVGPTSYDEAVEAASAEPPTAGVTEPAADEARPEPAAPPSERAAGNESGTQPIGEADTTQVHAPAGETDATQPHAPAGEADTIVEHRDSPEPHPGQSI